MPNGLSKTCRIYTMPCTWYTYAHHLHISIWYKLRTRCWMFLLFPLQALLTDTTNVEIITKNRFVIIFFLWIGSNFFFSEFWKLMWENCLYGEYRLLLWEKAIVLESEKFLFSGRAEFDMIWLCNNKVLWTRVLV